jgi:hypothetical protein
MQLEACRIIFASEMLSLEVGPQPSWLRDLILSNEMITTQAQFLPIRTPSEGRLRTLEIRGKKTLFEECPLEAQLHSFVLTEALVNQTAISDASLQIETRKILSQMQQSLQLSLSDLVYTWLMALIQSSSTYWLNHFRQRVYLPVSQSNGSPIAPVLGEHCNPWAAPDTTLEYPYTDTNEFDTLEIANEEATNEGSQSKKALHGEPSSTWPANFETSTLSPSQQSFPLRATRLGEELWPVSFGTAANSGPEAHKSTFTPNQVGAGSQNQNAGVNMGAYRLHDPNFYNWLGRELGRWVTSIMSPNNPNCHIPSDKEIQHYARFLMYDE